MTRKGRSNDRPLRIVLVDDHEVVRHGLRALLDAQADMEVVGEAGTAAEGVRRVGYDAPDLVVMDVRLPDGSGVENGIHRRRSLLEGEGKSKPRWMGYGRGTVRMPE